MREVATVAVQDQIPFNRYTANGATSVFPYGFLLLSGDDLTVSLNGSPLVLGVGFTVDGIGNPGGGSVTILGDNPASGADLLLLRQVQRERLTDYQTLGDFRADTVNRDFDRLWLAAQDQAAQLDRSIRLPLGDSASAEMIEIAIERAGRFLKFDENGAPVASITTDPVSVSAAESLALTLIAQAATEDAASEADDYRVQTGLDSAATAEDRVQTGLDSAATAEDRVQTGLDRSAAHTDRLLADIAAAAAAISATLANQYQANRGSARAVTTAALAAFTVSGGGTVLTGNANGSIPAATTDNVTLVAGDRLWYANPTGVTPSAPDYGLYAVTQQGTAGLPFILTRVTDADTAAELGFATAQIREGTLYTGAKMRVTNDPGAITLGTTPITVVLDSNAGATALANFIATAFDSRKVTDGNIQPLFEYPLGEVPVGLLNGDLWARGISPPLLAVIQGLLNTAGVLVSQKPLGWPGLAIYDPTSGRTHAYVGSDNEAHYYGNFKGLVEATGQKGGSVLASDGRTLYAAMAKLSTILATNTGVAKIAITGDSWAERWLIPQMLATMFYGKYGQSGDGWLCFDATGTVQNETSLRALNSAVISISGFTTHDISEEALLGQYSHDGFRFDATGTAFTAGGTGIKATSLKIYYLDTTGTFRYRVDGGAWTSVVGGGTGNPAKVTISGLSAGSLHTFDIDGTGNADTVSLFGVYAQHADKGVEFSKMGNGGITAPQLASVQALAAAAFILADIAPDAAICVLGTNDNRLNVMPSAYKTGLQTILTAYRTANSQCGFVKVAPPANGIGGTYPMTDYRDQLVDLANEQAGDYLNLTSAWSDYPTMAAQGSWFDTLHVNYGGARWIAGNLYDLFFLN